jgi:DnaJ-class molecular chaperone
VKLRVPTSIDERQRELLVELAEIEGKKPPEPKGVFDKVKDFFSTEAR